MWPDLDRMFDLWYFSLFEIAKAMDSASDGSERKTDRGEWVMVQSFNTRIMRGHFFV